MEFRVIRRQSQITRFPVSLTNNPLAVKTLEKRTIYTDRDTRRGYAAGIRGEDTRRGYATGIRGGDTRRGYAAGIRGGDTRRGYAAGILGGDTRRGYAAGIRGKNQNKLYFKMQNTLGVKRH